jgi:hypothetical protein
VAEAYRTVPLHPSQYPGLVVHTSEDCFAIDTSFCFGCSSAAGSYGGLADAGADIIRSEGIGPLSKWVDDHLFFHILLEFLERYNEQRKVWAKAIHDHGGLHIDGGRKWYRGLALYNDQPEEYDKDCSFPILDLSQCSPHSAEDARYSYCMDDINTISTKTGTPWEVSKDTQFCSEPPFTGFMWKLDLHTIEIPEGKKKKYLDAISEWRKPSLVMSSLMSRNSMASYNRDFNVDDMFADDNNKDILTHLQSMDSSRSMRQSTINKDLICCLQHMDSCQFFDDLSRDLNPVDLAMDNLEHDSQLAEQMIENIEQENEWRDCYEKRRAKWKQNQARNDPSKSQSTTNRDAPSMTIETLQMRPLETHDTLVPSIEKRCRDSSLYGRIQTI